MTENELFREAYLFLYAAAGKNIGFDVRPVPQQGSEKEQDKKPG